MAREAEVAALRVIEDAYQRWTVTSDQLHRDVGEAAERRGGAPVQSLSADFDAQLAITRAVAAFAHICPDTGPDIDGLPGAAFIQALYHVGSQPGLANKARVGRSAAHRRRHPAWFVSKGIEMLKRSPKTKRADP